MQYNGYPMQNTPPEEPTIDERSAFVAELLSDIQRIIQESGTDVDGFDAERWLERWLDTFVPALGGTPNSYLGTMQGRAIVRRTILQMQSGGYA